ncbi:unnamed protein product [Durusdinium trenchii]|uniref:Uncharacterized protein n=1 Tax=Durusdinium trenchii TaxID=1381693 RepID=A0ABP0Q9L4_9DINO
MAPSTELGLNHFQPPPKIGCVGWGLEEPQEQRESLLLDLPSPKQCREREQESHLGPLQGIDHLQEAEKVDLEALKARDPALKELLEDDTFALATPAAMSAFELYRRSLIALDAGRELAQKELRRLFETTTLRWDAENGGGQSLLEVALERQKHRAQTVLQEMKRRQTEAAAHADEPL